MPMMAHIGHQLNIADNNINAEEPRSSKAQMQVILKMKNDAMPTILSNTLSVLSILPMFLFMSMCVLILNIDTQNFQ